MKVGFILQATLSKTAFLGQRTDTVRRLRRQPSVTRSTLRGQRSSQSRRNRRWPTQGWRMVRDVDCGRGDPWHLRALVSAAPVTLDMSFRLDKAEAPRPQNRGRGGALKPRQRTSLNVPTGYPWARTQPNLSQSDRFSSQTLGPEHARLQALFVCSRQRRVRLRSERSQVQILPGALHCLISSFRVIVGVRDEVPGSRIGGRAAHWLASLVVTGHALRVRRRSASP